MTQVISRVHPGYLMNVSPPVGCSVIAVSYYSALKLTFILPSHGG